MSLFVKISEIKSKYHDFINILRMKISKLLLMIDYYIR